MNPDELPADVLVRALWGLGLAPRQVERGLPAEARDGFLWVEELGKAAQEDDSRDGEAEVVDMRPVVDRVRGGRRHPDDLEPGITAELPQPFVDVALDESDRPVIGDGCAHRP